MTIQCLFAKDKNEKYVVVESTGKTGFAHLRDLIQHLNGRFGKENYRLRFNYE